MRPLDDPRTPILHACARCQCANVVWSDLDQIPMRRFGTSEEVARSCIDLCLADEDYMTGSELKIHGGLYM